MMQRICEKYDLAIDGEYLYMYNSATKPMAKIETVEETCNDCELTLLYHNPRQLYHCEECGSTWSMETLND